MIVFCMMPLAYRDDDPRSVVVCWSVAGAIIVFMFCLYLLLKPVFTYHYIFKDSELIAYVAKKIIFKIQYDDVVELVYRKMPWWYLLICLIDYFLFSLTPYCVLGIHFYRAEVNIPCGEFCEDSLLDESDVNKREYIACFSYREAKRIAAIIGKPLKYVK